MQAMGATMAAVPAPKASVSFPAACAERISSMGIWRSSAEMPISRSKVRAESRGKQATGVIARGFAIAGSAGKGANIALFGEQANRLRKVGADGGSHDDQAETIGGTSEKSVVDAKVRWANVERTAFVMRDPIAIQTEEVFDTFEEEWLRNFGHGQARGGTV